MDESASSSYLRRRLQNQTFKTPIIDVFVEEKIKKQQQQHPLKTQHFLTLLTIILIVFGLVIVIERRLPTVLNETEPNASEKFNGTRAYQQLKNLISLGPRVAGSKTNEIDTIRLLHKELKKIQSQTNRQHQIDIDIQKVSGSFNLEFLDGMTNVYKDIQNIIVRIGRKNQTIHERHALLINCHFDTVVDSPGGSDDGAGCAIMLEILHILSQSYQSYRNDVIFLFNGAEENFMPASHGFITQHPWAKTIRTFINIESCGAGGREILFQAGPNHPWLLDIYAKSVPYPHASSLAQEIFQSGIIPGDTDYRIFRDFGNLSGLDFAWSTNGYVYHTKYDSIEHVPPGTLQRTGDNILAITKAIIINLQLNNIEQFIDDNLVFFDFLGAFVCRWTMFQANIYNIFTIFLSIFSIYLNIKKFHIDLFQKNYIKLLFNCIFIIIISWLCVIIFTSGLAIILTKLGRSMCWYARPIWILFLYIIPTLLVGMLVIYLHNYYYHKDLYHIPWLSFQLYYDGYQLIWTIMLFIGTLARIRSTFVALLWVLGATVGNLLKNSFFKRWQEPKKWLLLHISVMSLPFVQSFYLIIVALYLFIPILGRAGASSYAEIIIAIMISIDFILLFSFLIPIIILIRRIDRIISLLSGLSLIALAIIILTPLGFPYSADHMMLAPQRFMMAHTRRTFRNVYNETIDIKHGIWIVDMDINSPHTVDSYVPEMKMAKSVDFDCNQYLYCGMPYLVPVLTMLRHTHWLETEADLPISIKSPILNILSNQIIPDTNDGGGSGGRLRRRIRLHVAGSTNHIQLMMSPMLGVDLIGWSLDGGGPLRYGPKWNGRDTYFIFYAYGLEPAPLEFDIDFYVDKNYNGSLMDIGINAQYFYEPEKTTKTMKKFVEKFPKWTTISYWTATYDSWII